MLARAIRCFGSQERRPGRARGQVMVLFAFSLVGLVGMLGLVLDGGVLYVQRRTAQNGADAAALAGAYWLNAGASGPADTTVATGICAYVASNRSGPAPTATAAFVDASLTAVGAIQLTAGCTGAQPASAVPATATGVQVVVVIGPYPTYLVGIVGVATLRATATATATIVSGPAPQTILALSAQACPALSVTGSSSLTVEQGSVLVNSSCNTSNKALRVEGASSLTARHGAIGVVGTSKVNGSSTTTPAVTEGAVAGADPFALLPIPRITTLGVSRGAFTCSGPGSQTISPGIYSSVTISNTCALTFSPGDYIIGSSSGNLTITGGSSATFGNASKNTTIVLTHGMDLSNRSSATGTNVLFYNACVNYLSDLPNGCAATGETFGGLAFSGGANLAGVTPQATGPYQNLTFFQDRNNPMPMTINNAASFHAGTVYGQSMPVIIAGSATAPDQFVVDSLDISNGSSIDVTVTGAQEFPGAKTIGMAQ